MGLDTDTVNVIRGNTELEDTLPKTRNVERSGPKLIGTERFETSVWSSPCSDVQMGRDHVSVDKSTVTGPDDVYHGNTGP